MKNGKAFEYALAKTYTDYIQRAGVTVCLECNDVLAVAKGYYDEFPQEQQNRFTFAALQTIDTMVKLEPRLLTQNNAHDPLFIFLNSDSHGIGGDVRDVVFRRMNPSWEIGFSAKNNNDAVKHPRLSSVLDFGQSWFGIPCSQAYWDEIKPIFDYITSLKEMVSNWSSLGDEKSRKIYFPLLMAFRNELLRIDAVGSQIPRKLIQYLVGRYPFYKIIKDDVHNLVVVKAFNLDGELNMGVGGMRTRYRTPKINFPTRIVEFEMKPDSEDTLHMILDGGWEISFRIHNASKMIESSLKFDIKLLGNPPILFTQHLFQE